MDETRIWFITGASSGFGRALADAALGRGDHVVAAARDARRLADLAADDRVYAISLDVTDAARRDHAVAQALARFGRIDVLVNNAGRTQVGAVEETTDDELRSLFELEGLTQALHDEVAAFGIRTLIVEPGAFRTGLFGPARRINQLRCLSTQRRSAPRANTSTATTDCSPAIRPRPRKRSWPRFAGAWDRGAWSKNLQHVEELRPASRAEPGRPAQQTQAEAP
jgi:NAD(P)-dependent dehydrogenase (short-subunit alcohol dehydrogenase family)